MSTKNFVAGMEDVIPAVNDSPYKRILAIGDIHGSFNRLMNLWKKLNVTDEDLVIFLGDYFDGSAEDNDFKVLRWLMQANQKKNIIILYGNCDVDFVDDFVVENGTPRITNNHLFDVSEDLINAAEDESDIIERAYNFIKNLKYYHREVVGDREFIFCHGGIDGTKPLEKNPKSKFISGGSFYKDYEGDALVVVGHKAPKKVYSKFPELFSAPVDNKKPVKITSKNILLMDTRAKSDKGCVSCVNVLTGEFWQNDSTVDMPIDKHDFYALQPMLKKFMAQTK